MASRYNYCPYSETMTQWNLVNVSAVERIPVPSPLNKWQNITALNTGTNRVATVDLATGDATTICVSCAAMVNTTNWVLINLYSPDYSKSANAWFNLSTGLLGTLNYSGGLSGWSYSLYEGVEGEGKIIRLSGNVDSSGWHLEVRPVNGDTVYESDVGNSVALGGWQVERGTVRTKYKANAGNGVIIRTQITPVVSHFFNTAFIDNPLDVSIQLLDDAGYGWDQESGISTLSSDTGVATIGAILAPTDIYGIAEARVTPVGAGSTNITATVNGLTSAPFALTVAAAVTTRPPSLLLLGAGGNIRPPAPAPTPTPPPAPAPPPPPPAPPAVIARPTITSVDKVIGTNATRVIGTYDTGWEPIAGEWTINGTSTVIGTQAVCPSTALSAGDYMLYTETIQKAGEANLEAESDPYGPWVAPAPTPSPPPPPPPSSGYNVFVRDMVDFNHVVPEVALNIFPTPRPGFRWCGGYVNDVYSGGGSTVNMWFEVCKVANSDGSVATYSSAPNTKVVIRYMRCYRLSPPFTGSWTLVKECDSSGDFYNADWFDYRGYDININPSTGQPYGVVQRPGIVTSETGGYSVPIDTLLENPYRIMHHYLNNGVVGVISNNGSDAFSMQMQISKELINPAGSDDRGNIDICAHMGSDWNIGQEFMHGSYKVVPDNGDRLMFTITNIDVNKAGTYSYCYNYDDGVMSIAQLQANPPPIPSGASVS